ncbi:MAG: abortive infection family protein [Balneolaceae bacterium]
MAELTFIEKRTLEKFLEMHSGYVLDFSNRTIQEFIIDTMGIDIYDEKYEYGSGSKANIIRGFWRMETDYNVGLLIEKLCEYWIHQIHTGDRDYDQSDEIRYKECLKISARLKSNAPVENLDSLKPNSDDEDFSKLSKSIKDSIEKNEPETALDRLHTFVVKYIRELCTKHQIEFKQNHPLHSLFGSYVKYLISNNIIESDMTERILKSSISVLEAFNEVRNNQSFAHDNPILNYNESILIFNDISNVIKFIESIEEQDKVSMEFSETNDEFDDELPF